MESKFKKKITTIAFKYLDKDNDGVVKLADLQDYLKSVAGGEPDMLEAIEKLSFGGSDKLLTGEEEENEDIYAAGIFIYADKDEDKKVNLDEASNFAIEISKIYGKKSVTKGDMAKIFKEVDKNADGFLNIIEFTDFYEKAMGITS